MVSLNYEPNTLLVMSQCRSILVPYTGAEIIEISETEVQEVTSLDTERNLNENLSIKTTFRISIESPNRKSTNNVGDYDTKQKAGKILEELVEAFRGVLASKIDNYSTYYLP